MLTRDKIEKVYKEIQPHFVVTGDVDGYRSLFTEDAVWWPLGRRTRVGPEEIGAGFAEVVAGTTTTPVFDAMEIHVDDDGASGWAAMHGTETIVFDDHRPTEVAHSREVWFFRDVAGVAKISRMIWNASPL